jgi:hypothetical protein
MQAFLRIRPGAAVLLIVGSLTIGCSRGPQRAAPVNPDQAREALKITLESWKQGEEPAALRDRPPNITAQDMDWEAGLRLIEYQIVDDGKLDDANLRCAVKLALRDPQGRDVHKSVKYVVGTNPIITVFREVFP